MANRLYPLTDDAATAIASAQTSLPFPPTSVGVVPVGWTGGNGVGVVPELDVGIWAAASVTLTGAELMAGLPRPQVLSDDAVEAVTAGADSLTLTAHAYRTGDGPVQLTTSGVAPAGLAVLTDYYTVKTDANTIKLATSRALALAGTVIDITDAGSGTHTIEDTATTKRVRWHSLGSLGDIVLDEQRAAMVRVDHDPRAVAYALVATLSGAVATSVDMLPVMER